MPGVSCYHGSCRINTILHSCHNHNLPTWVLFANLVKAFDTSNHELLERYVCLLNLHSAIARMYKDSVVRLMIGKIETSIPFEVGVKQGDSIAPVFFLFIMMAFAETLQKEWIRNDLRQLQFCRHDNSPHSSGHITSHP